ncbi:hypothetical protein O181_002389 [Austropuccinia psidii MF-1]|uniref:HotDog ACOT-type domain-containing protein n=1 Tax=Austropuccinia psidii MF-1 TaxID=1389203 RepID=A0A9Q3BC65_9BASI|nr:hypothetical protein [Austropuccinia psidii MF-1]
MVPEWLKSLLSLLWNLPAILLFSVAEPKSFLEGLLEQASTDKVDVVLPKAKDVSASSFKASYVMLPEHADFFGRVFGGEVMKLIDVVAGIASKKHAGRPCVTISVDRVIFLCPVHVADILHLSVSVNRSWGSSMETGIKIIKEDAKSGKKQYACHAYMTFVARPKNAFKSFESSLRHALGLRASDSVKVQVPQVVPRSLLEHKRHLLAGRRRRQRLSQKKEWIELFQKFRKYVQSIPSLEEEDDVRTLSNEGLEQIQKQMIAHSYFKQDGEARLEGDTVIADLDEQSEPIKVPLSEITKIKSDCEARAFRRLSIPNARPTPPQSSAPKASRKILEIEETLATFVSIVRPEHCNSMSVLFGGTLMRWLEEVAFLSARNICPTSWVTAVIDSMSIRASARPGDVVKLRAIVIKVWKRSAEIYCLATTESQDDKEVFVSDAFFTLVSTNLENDQLSALDWKHVQTSNPLGQAIIDKCDQRRDERLSDRALLQKVYVSSGSHPITDPLN